MYISKLSKKYGTRGYMLAVRGHKEGEEEDAFDEEGDEADPK